MATRSILQKIRASMSERSLSAYLVFSCDAHQSEYTCDYDQRRAYISNFTGSAGSAVVTIDKALLWADGRYHLQAEQQLDECWSLMKDGLKETPSIVDWLISELHEGDLVGVDPKLISLSTWNNFSSKLKTKSIKLTAIEENLVDLCCDCMGKRSMPDSIIKPHGLAYSGLSLEEKIKNLRTQLTKNLVDSIFIYALDEIAWLFNIRGSDIPYCPVFKSYSIVSQDEVHLFIKTDGNDSNLIKHLSNESCKVSLHSYDDIDDFLSEFAKKDGKIIMDHDTPASFYHKFVPEKVSLQASPIQIAKAIKNPIEIECIKNACLRDSAALCQYFGWLFKNVKTMHITECSGADQLEGYRRKMKNFVDLSFNTISGSGSNGAIIHYDPRNSKPSPRIDPDKMYLCDSGAQYYDGTTDITRTYHFGSFTEKEKLAYTLVTKGHIDLAMAVFPESTKGHGLDALARLPLWKFGLDYLHGTGHGIGAFLNVHEGPQRISIHALNDHELLSGMLCSNEPGYYEDGEFGIRFENMIFVVPATKTKYNFKGKQFCTFETVSYVPIQTSLLDTSLMTKEEIDWLNDYHQKCLEKVSPILKEMGYTDGLEWLTEFTKPI